MTKAGLQKLVTKPHIFIRDYTKKNKKIKKQVKLYAEKAIDLNIPFHRYYYDLYKKFNESKAFPLAEKSLQRAIDLKEKIEYYHLLIKLLKRKNQWWQIVEVYEKALKFDNTIELKYYLEYAYALEKMNRFEKICEVLKPFAESEELNSDGFFKYGHALKKIGELDLSEEVFSKAIALDKSKGSQNLGIGIFYEKRGEWIPAKNAYEKSLKREEFNADIQYKHGLSLERCYLWEESEEEHLKAIGLKPNSIYWYYKLGFVRERKGDYKGASDAYLYAATKRITHTPYWYYRLGYVLTKLDDFENACNAFLMIKKIELDEMEEDDKSLYLGLFNDIDSYRYSAIKKLKERLLFDSTDTAVWNELVNLYTDMELYTEASDTLKELIARNNNFNANLYFTLGHLLTLAKRYKEATEAFFEYRVLQDAHGVLENNYNKDKGFKKVVNYTEYYERHKIEDKTILYESYHGRSIACNPYALFKEIYRDKRFQGYKHIWAINDFEIIPDDLKTDKNIIFVKRESDLYLRYLTKAKYLINNTSFSEYFIRKDEQVYLNTWHGTPLKLMGKDAKDEFLSHKNISRNFLHTSHLIHPNRFTLDVMLESYDIKSIYNGVVAEIGYPRQDLMLNISIEEKQEFLDTMNIEEGKTVVLYAPTWRGSGVKDVQLDTEKLLEDIEILSQREDVHLLYRGHYMAEEFLKDIESLDNTIVPSSIDTNSLLSIVDVLITDYSSIAFDFMAQGKPILYYAYDIEEYAQERGFKFELEEITDNICENNQALSETLDKVLLDLKIDLKQVEAQKRFCAYDDGQASKRVIDLLFFNKVDKKYIVKFEKKESILFYGGTFTPYGITTSLLNLTANIDHEKYNVNVVLEPSEIKDKIQREEQFNRLSTDITILGKFGKMNTRLEEKWIIDKLNSQRELASNEMWDILYATYKREFLRVFGHVNFSHIINFEGYNAYWIRLFTQENSKLYLHNEMLGEAQVKYTGLYGTFQLYKKYSHLISVSFDVDKANKENLSKQYNIPLKNFSYCDNLLNPNEILEKAQESLEQSSEERLFINGKTFINMARLSPEKDQEKLIKSFSRVVKKDSESKLIILGQGPLEGELKSLVKKISMQKNIFILGQRFNPMPYLKSSDCFVLSSNHEGQGLVLLEAMILGKPVISTDIVGPRSVIEGRPGLLVENSEDGLYNGMLDFLEGRYKEDKKFDYNEYNQNALEMFYNKVLNKEEK